MEYWECNLRSVSQHVLKLAAMRKSNSQKLKLLQTADPGCGSHPALEMHNFSRSSRARNSFCLEA